MGVVIQLLILIMAYPQSAQSQALAEEWKSQYLTAKNQLESDEGKACKTFSDLSKQLQFPLRKLALVRSITPCNRKKEPDWSKLRKFVNEPWLKPSLIREQFNYYEKRKKPVKAFFHQQAFRKYIDLDDDELTVLAEKALKGFPNRRDRKKIEKVLHKVAPRFKTRPRKSDYLKVARDFRKARDFTKALNYYQKVIDEKGFNSREKWYAYKGIRTTYKLRRWSRQKEYIDASRRWARFLKKRFKSSKALMKLHHNSNISYVRTLWTERSQAEAKKVLDELHQDLNGRYSLQLVYWLLGKMAEERKEYDKTIEYLAKASKEPILSPEDHTRILWNLAWNQRRQKQYEDSIKNLRKLLKEDKELTFYTRTKYDFWIARNLDDMGDKAKAKEAYKDLADLDLFGYYGALAYRALNEDLPKIDTKHFSDKELWSMFKKGEDYRIFSWLVDTEELDASQTYLESKIKKSRRWSVDQWVKYLLLMQKSGNYIEFFVEYHSLKPRLQVDVLKQYPYLLFPRPFEPIVDKAVDKTQVSKALIYSIMKQESGFDPKARSFADAFGLMQLLPQVAERTSASMSNVGYKTAEDLYRPKVNIMLGAKTLQGLLQQFQSQFVLTVASYNSSKKAVNGWVQSRFFGDPVTFIEDIPYEETKGYVKLVMRNYISYQRFFEPDKSHPFPETCLEGLQSLKN